MYVCIHNLFYMLSLRTFYKGYHFATLESERDIHDKYFLGHIFMKEMHTICFICFICFTCNNLQTCVIKLVFEYERRKHLELCLYLTLSNFIKLHVAKAFDCRNKRTDSFSVNMHRIWTFRSIKHVNKVS